MKQRQRGYRKEFKASVKQRSRGYTADVKHI